MAEGFAPTLGRRWHEWLPLWVPLIIGGVAFVAAVGRTEGQISDLAERQSRVEASVAAVPERLARIEQNQTDSRVQLDRIEGRLDGIKGSD